MKLGTYADGRDINYDDARKSFDVGGSPVTIEQLEAYDGAGQVAWASPETRSWFMQNLEGLKAAAAAPSAAPAAPSIPAASYGAPAPSSPVPPAGPAGAPGAAKKKPLVWIIIGVVVIILACVGCGVAGAVIFSSDTTVDSQDDTREDADEERESEDESDEEPEPVVEEEEAQEEEVVEDYSVEEAEYSLEVATISYATGDAITVISELLINDPEGVLYGGDSYYELAANVEIVRGQYQAALALTPPPTMAHIHDSWLGGLKDFNDSMDLMMYGIDNQDVDSLDQATVLMQSGSDKIVLANEQLTEFADTRQ